MYKSQERCFKLYSGIYVYVTGAAFARCCSKGPVARSLPLKGRDGNTSSYKRAYTHTLSLSHTHTHTETPERGGGGEGDRDPSTILDPHREFEARAETLKERERES